MKLSPAFRPLIFAASLLGLAAVARAEVPSTALPAVDHYVYLRFLPKASELAQDAKINGLTILRIDETADRVIVSYQYPDGHTATLGYALLGSKPPSVVSRPSSVAPPSTARYVVTDRDPEIIYVERPSTTRVIYTDPWYGYWAPVTVGFGLGWATSYYSGSYYRGGHHYHGGGYYKGGYRGGYHGGGYRGGYYGGGRGGSQGGHGRGHR